MVGSHREGGGGGERRSNGVIMKGGGRKGSGRGLCQSAVRQMY